MQIDPWQPLRALTAARIALGRSGGSLPTQERLEFQLAHARARDAVLSDFDPVALGERLQGLNATVLLVESAARDRAEFLQAPDRGRMLAAPSRELLNKHAETTAPCDLAIIISDGLSTLAANTQAEPLLAALLPLLRASGWTLAPLVIARHARVALQDEIGEIFTARLSLMLLGERPGLGSADSLGAYFTFAPKPGRSDAERNCISNIRAAGLTPALAAQKLVYLLERSRELALSGVRLKDDSPSVLPGDAPVLLR